MGTIYEITVHEVTAQNTVILHDFVLLNLRLFVNAVACKPTNV